MTPSNLSIAQAYLDHLWSRKNLYFVELLLAPDCIVRDSLFGDSAESQHVKAQVSQMHEAFPDLAYSIEEVIANVGNQLALRWSARGTHRGPLLGIPATNRSVALAGVLLLRFVEARLIAITSLWEPYSMFQQLGLVPGAHQGSALARLRLTKAASPRVDVAAVLLQERMSAKKAPVVDIDGQWDM